MPVAGWRILAAVIVAVPVLSALLIRNQSVLFIPPALAVAGFMASKVAWPPFLRLCIAGLIAWPIVILPIHSNLQVLVIHWAISAFFLFLLQVPAIWRSVGLPAGLAKALQPETYKSLAAKGVPLLATTTHRETPKGVEYTVMWTDFAKLRFADREGMIQFLPFASFVLLLFGLFARDRAGEIGDVMITLGVLAGVGWPALWLFSRHYQRNRLIPRSLVIRPDGTLVLTNPPPLDANTQADPLPRIIPNGLDRLSSIEYGKTAEWHSLRPEHVYAVEDWYDVHLVFGTQERVSVSRNLGSRDHAHQVAGELNNLKAALARQQAVKRTPAPKMID